MFFHRLYFMPQLAAFFKKIGRGELVSFQTKSADRSHASGAEVGDVAVILARKNIAQVNFHHRDIYRGYRVGQCDGGVRVPSGVKDNSIAVGRRMEAADEFSFDIA